MELSRISDLIGGYNFNPAVFTKAKAIISGKQPIVSALASPDTLFSVSRKTMPSISAIVNFNIFSVDPQLQQKQIQSLNSARTEWQNGVKEDLGRNSGKRVNQYYKNSGFSPGGDGGWCGFFVSFNYAQAGFKASPHLAGMEKARDFFMYRQYTDRSKEKNAKLDGVKQEQQIQGSTRQYFMLEESPNLKNIKDHKNTYKNYNSAANTFNYNFLPIRGGDTVLFNTGEAGGHVGMVESYNPLTGKLVTIEGNAGGGRMANGKTAAANAVVRKDHDLTDPKVRARIDGFGRPALGDFN